MSKSDTYRERLALHQGTEQGTEPNTATDPDTKPERKARRKKETGTLAKTAGHELINTQRRGASEVLEALEKGEEVLNATLGYQQGQYLADIRMAGSTAGFLDRFSSQKIDNLQALESLLKANSEKYDPLSILADLGLVDTEDDDSIKDKSRDLSEKDYSVFLH